MLNELTLSTKYNYMRKMSHLVQTHEPRPCIYSYPDPPRTTLHKTTTIVTVREGDSFNISCTSAGNPIPPISWERDGFPAPFPQRDSVTQYQVGHQQLGFIQGNASSVLMISKATYPNHNGLYTCIGFNSHKGRSTTNRATITVNVLGMYVHE